MHDEIRCIEDTGNEYELCFMIHQVQKEQRHAYNTYIEKLILDLPTNDPAQSFNNQSKPKKALLHKVTQN